MCFDLENHQLVEHVALLLQSYHGCTGRQLIASSGSAKRDAELVFAAPFGVVSHNTDEDPIFNYGNQTALDVFEMTWAQLTAMPSRLSAEQPNRQERARLLAQVAEQGYIDDYSGIRISRTGKRFRIENATVWNVVDETGVYRGQAAVFYSS